MNTKAQKVISAIWIFLGLLFILVLIALISPLSDILTPVIGVDGLNCAVPTDGYRGSCIVIRGSVLIFVLGIGYYVISGVLNKIRGR